EQILRRFVHFASKSGLEIEHLGEKVMEQLVTLGFVKKFSDIFTLTEKELSELQGFKDKAIKNLLTSIEKAKSTSLARLIMALGIRHVGTQMAEELANHAKTLEKLASMKEEDLLALSGVGEKVAHQVASYFHDKHNLAEIAALIKHGVSLASTAAHYDPSHPFYEKNVVITGTLSMPRSEAANLIRKVGGRIADTVSKKVDYLIVG